MTVRTRFAPSPTGYLHIGGVRTALFNYLLAKQAGGEFILRIDDTDNQRNVQEALEPILEGFRWLGLQWDEGPGVGGPCAPYFQSQKLARYQEEVNRLLASGNAYRDYATPEELAAQRESNKSDSSLQIYDRRWMAETDDQAKAFEAQGRTAVVRLKMPREGKCQFHDLIRGDVEFDWVQEQDHVIQRADGTCLYHLASVVDDFDFKISHVVRAIEHLPNTPRQVFIAQSLGYPLPIYAHLPYVAEPGGTAKLSKRKLDKYLKQKDFASLNAQGAMIANQLGIQMSPETFNPVVVDFYREIGFLPGALLNYLLLLGWSLDDSTEHFTLEDAVRHFSLERVNKAPASLDPQKMVSFQTRWMNLQDETTKLQLVLPFLTRAKWLQDPVMEEDKQFVLRIIRAAGDRIKIAGDILQFDEFFVDDERLSYDEAAWEKRIGKDPHAMELVLQFASMIPTLAPFEASNIEKSLKEWLDQNGFKIGQIIHALRLAVSGKAVGLGMFEMIEILGKDRVAHRIELAKLKAALK